jgi:ribosome-binding factor A
VCITVDGQPDYEQCFNVTVEQPEDLAVSSRINGVANTVSLDLSGASVYYINLNGNTTTTSENSIELSLIKGVNTLTVSTDKDCQGVYRETINNLDVIRVYPNPFSSDAFTVNMGKTDVKNVHIKLVSLVGKVILSKDFSLNNGTTLIEVPNLATGVYLLDVNDGNSTTNFKIIKK